MRNPDKVDGLQEKGATILGNTAAPDLVNLPA
jgi:hypothetical protein